MTFRPAATVLLFSKREEEAIYLLVEERLRGMWRRLPGWLRVQAVRPNGATAASGRGAVTCEARCAGVGRPLPHRGRIAAPLAQGDGVARLVVTDAVEVVAHQQQAAPGGPRQPRLVERVVNGGGVETLALVLDLGP